MPSPRPANSPLKKRCATASVEAVRRETPDNTACRQAVAHSEARGGPSQRAGTAVTLVALLIVLCAGCVGSVDLEALQTFQEAQTAFDNADSPEDFLRAAGLYQEILDRGIVSGAVLYNQGNAFMGAGRRGRAVAAYRQAMRYRPRDRNLQANLSSALGNQSSGQRRPLIETLLFWQDWLSYPEKFYLLAAAAAVTFAFGVLWLFVWPRLFARLAIAAAGVTLLLAFSAGYDWYRFDYTVSGVIVQKEVVARKGNAAGYEPAFTKPLTEGTEFRLVERRGDWLLIRLQGAQEGWVEEETVVLY